LSRQELRRPREEDKEYANSLLKHLNDHLEHYHRAIWVSMDAQRRYMLLDGFIAPNSGGRSVASVVENRMVGIIGNCLVMPVARGFHLDPTFNQIRAPDACWITTTHDADRAPADCGAHQECSQKRSWAPQRLREEGRGPVLALGRITVPGRPHADSTREHGVAPTEPPNLQPTRFVTHRCVPERSVGTRSAGFAGLLNRFPTRPVPDLSV
jgi:hypothetical protein